MRFCTRRIRPSPPRTGRSGHTDCQTGSGRLGPGFRVAIYGWTDTQTYNNDGVWQKIRNTTSIYVVDMPVLAASTITMAPVHASSIYWGTKELNILRSMVSPAMVFPSMALGRNAAYWPKVVGKREIMTILRLKPVVDNRVKEVVYWSIRRTPVQAPKTHPAEGPLPAILFSAFRATNSLQSLDCISKIIGSTPAAPPKGLSIWTYTMAMPMTPWTTTTMSLYSNRAMGPFRMSSPCMSGPASRAFCLTTVSANAPVIQVVGLPAMVPPTNGLPGPINYRPRDASVHSLSTFS